LPQSTSSDAIDHHTHFTTKILDSLVANAGDYNMTRRSNRFICAIAVTAGLGIAGFVQAEAQISAFNNFNLGGTYAAWSDPNVTTITSGSDSLQVESLGFGGGFSATDGGPANGSGTTTVQFDVTVNAGDTPNVLAVLEDGDGTQWAYRWYVLPAGNHVLTQPTSPVPGGGFNGINYDSFESVAGGVAGFDFSSIPFFHIQIDAHGSSVPYNVAFNDLRLTGVIPEPGSIVIALGAIGMLATTGRRKRDAIA
jgi:hypothetical protein